MSQEKSLTSVFGTSDHAQRYSCFRPKLPHDVCKRLMSFLSDEGVSLDLALDVGCGSGQCTMVIAPYFKKVIGMDVSKAQIDQASKDAANVSFVVHDCNKPFPVEPESADVIISMVAIHWLDQDKVVSNFGSALKPGGVVAIVDYGTPIPSPVIQTNPDLLHSLTSDLLLELNNFKNDQFYLLTLEQLAKPFKEAYQNQLIIGESTSIFKAGIPNELKSSPDELILDYSMSLADYIGLLETISYVNSAPGRLGRDAYDKRMNEYRKAMKEALNLDASANDADVPLTIRNYFGLALIKKPKV